MNRPKIILLLGLLLFALQTPQALAASTFDHSHTAFTNVLRLFVNDEGLVNYRDLKGKPEYLERYLQSLASVDAKSFESWSKNQRIAFLINLYNAATLQLILDHYPLKSIKDIGGWLGSPWKKKIVPFFGENVTLDYIEHDLLREQFKEPRIHFALVCAAKSCPPLRREAYQAKRLKNQFDSQARIFLATPSKNRLEREDHELRLSKIFSWFERDFTSVSSSVVQYLMPFFSAEDRNFLRNNRVSVRYTDYDWSLNEAP